MALWKGQYIQGGKFYPFELNLSIQGNTLRGEGRDGIGSFSLINGQVSPAGQVSFIKQYHGQHAVNYLGQLTRDRRSMNGTYSVGSAEGCFMMAQQ